MPHPRDIEGANLGRVPPDIDTTVPQSARVYDYWLGGKDNYAADRALGDAIAEHLPGVRTMVRSNRAFLGRAVRYLVRDAGIRQFLDIGTGIPTFGNVHEVAQEIAPDTRVLYVDNDPIVLAHARALMTSHPDGRTAFIAADLRQPREILADAILQETLDLTQPVALMLVSIAMHLVDADDPYGIVATLVDALPSGSHLTITHPTADFDAQGMAAVTAANEQAGVPFVPRSRAEVEAFFTGLDLVEPGVVPVATWRPDAGPPKGPHSAHWAGVGRKPCGIGVNRLQTKATCFEPLR